MTLNELYKMLDMEEPADFEYFEQFADLLETDEDVPFDLFYTALSAVTPENAGELVENYFEDLTKAAPDDENDLVLLIDSVEQNLLLLAADIEDQDARRSFAEQLFKFREWYKKSGSAEIEGASASVFEALLQAREDALCGGSHVLDFSGAQGFELDNASYGLGRFSKINIVPEEAETPEEGADDEGNA